jgi:hypothetical protein
VSYDASAVKNYKALSSLVRFENKNIFFYFLKTLYSRYHSAAVVVVNSKVAGLGPGRQWVEINYSDNNCSLFEQGRLDDDDEKNVSGSSSRLLIAELTKIEKPIMNAPVAVNYCHRFPAKFRGDEKDPFCSRHSPAR